MRRSESGGRLPGAWLSSLTRGLRRTRWPYERWPALPGRATSASRSADRAVRELVGLAEQLLAQRGEVSGLALADQVAEALGELDETQTASLLEALAAGFGPDRAGLEAAIDAWRAAPDQEALLRLSAAVEPPRQELFRRLNMAPGGTLALVRLRARLLRLLPQRPELLPVDADLRHLFASWFNRGFLQLEQVTWDSPASVLERLIRYEAVHEIQGWEDLRSRLAADRRCYGFFHPSLPGEPLIFVEVALARGLPAAIGPLIDPRRQQTDPASADTAVFFSISNCQPGLRGVSFGNLLIKQVVSCLADDVPGLRSFATISPLPGLGAALAEHSEAALSADRVRRLIAEQADDLCQLAEVGDPLAALRTLLPASPRPAAVARALTRLALAYLTQVRRGIRVADSVAHFHLANGARLERIDPEADLDHAGGPSCGVMVNYLYELDRLELNHERYVETGEVVTAPGLRSAVKRVEAAWG